MTTTKATKATAKASDQKKHLALYEALHQPADSDREWALRKFNKKGFVGLSIHHQWRIQEMQKGGHTSD